MAPDTAFLTTVVEKSHTRENVLEMKFVYHTLKLIFKKLQVRHLM